MFSESDIVLCTSWVNFRNKQIGPKATNGVLPVFPEEYYSSPAECLTIDRPPVHAETRGGEKQESTRKPTMCRHCGCWVKQCKESHVLACIPSTRLKDGWLMTESGERMGSGDIWARQLWKRSPSFSSSLLNCRGCNNKYLGPNPINFFSAGGAVPKGYVVHSVLDGSHWGLFNVWEYGSLLCIWCTVKMPWLEEIWVFCIIQKATSKFYAYNPESTWILIGSPFLKLYLY